ncbi:YqeG family HAD IIIA-type phosphatase [bacterium]|nr:YqeG family HAD IIIA-type phosphatase [bacterium]MBU1024678.1 YqeG family HAD IIIA-type phosphatase [bacterium]
MSLRPSLLIHRVTEITLAWLKKESIKGLLLDVDNTLTPYHSEEIPEDILSWLEMLKNEGIPFIPYSNAKPYRIGNFCKRFGLPNPGMAIKPLNLRLTRTIRLIGIPKKNLLVVGDQVFTDGLAGKFGGLKVVLVDPVSTVEFPATKIMRKIEHLVGRHKWKYDKIF